MAAHTIAAVVERTGIDPERIADVYLGAANQSGEDNRDVARMAALLAGLPHSVPGATVNRLCASGLEAINAAARAVKLGEGDFYLAGGVESMSRAPWVVGKPERGLPRGPQTMHDTTLGWRFVDPPHGRSSGHATQPIGETGERVAERWRQPRGPGRLRPPLPPAGGRGGRLGPLRPRDRAPAGAGASLDGDGRPVVRDGTFARDEGPRRDTSAEALAKLKPVFKQGGTVTAGNSSQRSDGAAAVVVMERERAERLGLEPLGRFVGYAVGGVAPEVMGIGPTVAVPKVLELTGLTLDDIDLIELNEAFASQTLAVHPRARPRPRQGQRQRRRHRPRPPHGRHRRQAHRPLLAELARRDGRYGMVTMCVGGGQGLATVFEAV